MKRLITFTILATLSSSIMADTTGFASFIQRKNTFAVIDKPVRQLYNKGPFTLSVDGLFGANATTQEPALGAGVVLHYAKTTNFSLFAGVGDAYDVSKKFQLSDVNSKSIGFVFGATWSH